MPVSIDPRPCHHVPLVVLWTRAKILLHVTPRHRLPRCIKQDTSDVSLNELAPLSVLMLMMLASSDLGAFFGIMKTQPIDWSKNLSERKAPLDMNGEQFRKLGHRLVDQIAEFLDG